MVIGWQFWAYDIPYIRRGIELAKSLGVNHLQLAGDVMMYLKHVSSDGLRPRLLNELVDLAHRRGIEVYLWVVSISYLPSEYVVNDRANLEDPALWQHEANEWATLLRRVPDFDGVVLSFGDSCHYHLYNDSQVISSLPKDQRMLKYIGMAYEALSSRGKSLIMRDWAGGDWTVKAIHAAPPDVGVMTKSDIGDWQQTDPHNPHIGAFPERRQLVEFDLCGEYTGRWTPWCAPEYIQYRWRHGHGKGAAGAVGRADVYDLGHHIYALPYGISSEAGPSSAIDTPSEINLYAFTKIVRNPDADVNGIWQEWAERRYGSTAAMTIIPVLKRSFDLAYQVFWRRAYVGLFKTLPTLGYLERIARTDGVIGHRLEELAEPAALTAALEEEYAAPEAACVECLAAIEQAKADLAPPRYRELVEGFSRLQWYIIAWRQVHLAYVLYKTYEMQGRPEAYQRLSAELQGLLDLATAVESRFGPNHWPSNPTRLRQFAAELRDVSNYYHKQVLRKQGPPIETSLFIPR